MKSTIKQFSKLSNYACSNPYPFVGAEMPPITIHQNMSPTIERYPGRDEWKVYKHPSDRDSIGSIRRISSTEWGWRDRYGLHTFSSFEMAISERVIARDRSLKRQARIRQQLKNS